MKKRITILFVIAIAISSLAFGQKENYNWYFGYHAGVTFNTPDGHPVPLISNSMKSKEGCASISDKDGNLLFYTNGDTVWNKEDKIMPFGTGLNGHYSSTQTALIVKQPGTTNLYYIFTSDQGGYYGLNKGIYYSIVDMNQDNGKGDIIRKNSYILMPATEKLIAIPHRNNKDYWIVMHEWNSNRFFIYLFDKQGVALKPIINSVGSIHASNNNFCSIGYMKSSPNRKRIALGVVECNYIELFDFDNLTGTISNPILIRDKSGPYAPYGLEFSPDSKKLYYRETDSVFQLNLDVIQVDEIYSNRICVSENAKMDYKYACALQLGPDGIIYLADSLFLCSINKPDQLGLGCEFKKNSVKCSLGDGFARLGLPNNINGMLYVSLALLADTICPGDTLKLMSELKGKVNNVIYSWSGPNGFKSNQANPVIPNASEKINGIYTLKAYFDYDSLSESIQIKIFPKPTIHLTPNDTVFLCDGSSIYLKNDLAQPNVKYFWSTGEVTQNITVTKPGKYVLYAENAMGCRDSSFVIVLMSNRLMAGITGNKIFCIGESTDLKAEPNGTGYTYIWSTGETTPLIKISKPGYYWVKVYLNATCQDSTGITVIQSDKPKVTLSALGATSFCEGDSVVLQAKAGIGYSYQWGGDYYKENFENRRSFPEWSTQITDPDWQNPIKPDSNDNPTKRYLGLFGNQLIKLTLDNLPLHDSVDVTFDMYVVATWDGNVTTENGPDLFRVLDLSCNTLYSSTTSFARMEGANQSYPDRYPAGNHLKETGAIEKLMINNEQVSFGATIYRLNYRFAHDCTKLQLGLNALLNDISSNFQNESWAIDNFKLRLSTVLPDTNVTYKWTTGETVQSISVGRTGNYQVEVMNQAGCTDTASIYIKVNPNPIPTISGKTKLCQSEKTTLTVDGDYTTYQWSTGDATKSITVEAPIKYAVIVTDSNGCTGAAEVLVEKNANPKVSIIGDTVFCAGDTVKLSADGDFTAYQWESGEMTKEIIVTQGGTYKLTVTDANGCQNNAEHTLTEYKINTAGLVDLDYGTLAAGADIKKDMIFTNKSNTAINITKIFAKNAVKEFFVSTVPDLPKLLSPDSSLTISVSFRPNDYMDYADQLIVESDSPCAFTKGIAMKGTTSTMTLVWLPDTTAKIGDPDFCIPLMARRDANISISDPMSFTAEIRFNATAMLPNNLNSTIIAGERVLNISADNIKLDSINTEIFQFCGQIFLPDKDFTPLLLTDFKWSKSNVSANRQDGSLKIKGLCQPSISRITLLNKHSFQIMENPVIDELTIQLSESLRLSESVKVEIYSTLGLKMYSVGAGSKPAQEIRIDVSSLTSGMYFVRIGDRVGKFVKL